MAMKKRNKIVFNKFLKNKEYESIDTYTTWYMKAYFKTAEEAKAAIKGIKLVNPKYSNRFSIRGRGKWTPEKIGKYVAYQIKKFGEIKNEYLPDDMPIFLADYVVLYIY